VWKDEDYDILADIKVVGRIYESSVGTPPELRWFWSITDIIRVPGVVTRGHARGWTKRRPSFATTGRKRSGPLGPPTLHRSSCPPTAVAAGLRGTAAGERARDGQNPAQGSTEQRPERKR